MIWLISLPTSSGRTSPILFPARWLLMSLTRHIYPVIPGTIMLPCTIQQLMAIRNVSDTSKYRNVTVIGNDYTGHINRTRLWTTKFIPTSNHSISPPSTPDPFIPFVNTPFAPSQVIFVTDFRSYSAASVLLKQVQLYHLAKVICFR